MLAKTVIKEGIVDSISSRHIGRILNEINFKPWKVEGWLYPKEKDPEVFRKKSEEVCNIYLNAINLAEQGTYVICSDEMCGIKAIEHCHPSMPAIPGYYERIEQEYKRHGTTGIIASRHVVTGEIINPLIQAERKEVDFVKHISNVIDANPEVKYIFILDNLNTHKSESLVKLVIDKCGLEIDEKTLGIKERSGILKSMKTREEFLSNPEHNIRFVYTPKHASWLNQIEIWFSIIKRHVLNKRASFKSIKEIETKIREYIEYYNEHLAKPFNWTCTGKVLAE